MGSPEAKKPKRTPESNIQKKKKTEKEKKKKKSCGTLILDDLKTLCHQLLSSRAHINNLPVILSVLSPSARLELALESIISLQSFFVPLVPEIPSASAASSRKRKAASGDAGEEENAAESVFKVWLRERFNDFVNKLVEITVSPESVDVLKDVALEAIMDFVKMGKEGKFQSAIYHRFLHSCAHAPSDINSLLDMLAEKYFKYTDVRYFTYTSMDKIIKNFESRNSAVSVNVKLVDGEKQPSASAGHAIHIMYNILSRFPPLEPDEEQINEMWSQMGILTREEGKKPIKDGKAGNLLSKGNKASAADQILRKIKSRFTRAWISFLRLPLPLNVYKEVLVSVHQIVIPYMANPSILCDFLTRSYDIGGVISVMALSGLFILMTQRGLEYPKFYEKLYALLTPSVFMAKHRAAFFQLLDSCLKSSYLPAYLAAAFAKKLSRLALSVPPSGVLIIIAVIHNLLRRHPSINFLVHQEIADAEDGVQASVRDEQSAELTDKSDTSQTKPTKMLGVDPFKVEESDPAKSDAMRSSLWEIDTIRHHYSPAVSRFVDSLESDLTVRAKTSEIAVSDFSSASYATVFRDEIRRRVKQVPLAFYRSTPSSLFCSSDFAGWMFSDLEDKNQEVKAQ